MTTLEELDAALAAMPASPIEPADVKRRADLMRKRILLADAVRNPPPAPPQLGAMVTVTAPPDVSCVRQKSGHGYFYAEDVDGQHVVKMDWATFSALVTSINGGLWQMLNQGLLPELNNFGAL